MEYYTKFSLNVSTLRTELDRVEGVDIDGNLAVIFVERKIDLEDFKRKISNGAKY